MCHVTLISGMTQKMIFYMQVSLMASMLEQKSSGIRHKFFYL